MGNHKTHQVSVRFSLHEFRLVGLVNCAFLAEERRHVAGTKSNSSCRLCYGSNYSQRQCHLVRQELQCQAGSTGRTP